MGQQASKNHAPLTFGYVNNSDGSMSADQILDEADNEAQDFVLDNPHLYRLEMSCKNRCSERRSKKRDSSLARPEGTIVLATTASETCELCFEKKRLSLVRTDLVMDLQYIDSTYYPDTVHYSPAGDDATQGDLPPVEVPNTLPRTDSWSKLTIGDVTPGKRHRRLTGPSTKVMNLSSKSLVQLGPNIGFLDNLTRLTLSHNQMTSLPPELGYLKNLRFLNAAFNQLETLPDTITYLTKLKILNLGNNQLTCLPLSMGFLPKLAVLAVGNNRLEEIPRELSQLTTLISLDISNNPLKSLPAEFATLKSLRKLNASGCNFLDNATCHLVQEPPSLFELCARAAVQHAIPIPSHMSESVREYIARAQACSFCGKPYFDTFVTRYRFIERVFQQKIALEYRLCSAHWTDNDDRLLMTFSTPSVPDTEQSKLVTLDGLQTPTLRSRSNSESSRLLSNMPALTLSPSTSSQVSRGSSSSLSTCYSDLESPSASSPFLIRMMKHQPSLPALPAEPSYDRSPPAGRTRARASSSASTTRRLAGLLSPIQHGRLKWSHSSTSLRRFQINEENAERDRASQTANRVDDDPPLSLHQADRIPRSERVVEMMDQLVEMGAMDHAESTIDDLSLKEGSSTQPSCAGLSHLNARFTRDRSGTV